MISLTLRRRFARLAALAGLAVATDCSHQQKPSIAALHLSTPARTPVFAVPWALAAETPPPPAPTEKGAPAIFFDFDSATLRDDARPILRTVSYRLRGQSLAKLRIEGNCDQLGTVEYNLALGDERARAAKEYLVHLGVPDRKITTISFGAQRPKYSDSDDAGRSKNRRDDLVMVR
jgi:peptidoglycan-associated lipoprotein